MCRFFAYKKVNIGMLSVFTVAPFIAAIVSFAKDNTSDAYFCLSWVCAITFGASLGYALREQRKCALPHVAENIIVEQEVEGNGEELEMEVPVEVLPRIEAREPGEPSQLRPA